MLNCKLRAIVLKRINFGEADRLLTVFSLEKGKVTLIAKGVRRIRSRRAPHLEPLSVTELVVRRSVIIEARSLFYPRRDLKFLGLVFYAIEIVDRLLPDSQPHEDIYELLESLLQEEELNIGKIKAFTVKVLWLLGFFPANQCPDKGINAFVEQIIERPVYSKKFLEKL